MQIQTNTSSLFAQRQLARHASGLSQNLQRLSSGLRINSAKDDAAGLAIGERMQAQMRGMRVAVRNANDSISMLQVAEGAMASIGDSLQRIRELAVQAANSTNSVGDRLALNNEAQQLASAISQTAENTEFNGKKVFSQSTASIQGDPDKKAVLDGLQLGWLEQSENRIRDYFGIEADGVDLEIDLTFTDGAGGFAAQVSYTATDGQGRALNQKLSIDMADFTPPNLPNGGTAPFYNDRIIAHEMVHAVMGRAMSFHTMPTWFKEGAAEIIHGADERVLGDGVANVIANRAAVFGGWGSTSLDYSTAYTAVRYMHHRLKEMGASGGIKALMTHLSTNLPETLDAALNAVTGGVWANVAAFQAEFTGAQGATFINGMDLGNTDTGAIGGLDADSGPELSAEDVIQDTGTRSGTDVLAGFNENFPDIGGGTGAEQYAFQLGPNPNQTIVTSFSAVNAWALNIADIDLVSKAQFAIVAVDGALDFVNQQRSRTGAVMKRVEAAIDNLQSAHESLSASRARIVDADYAEETAQLSKTQILQQAANMLVAQANTLPQLALQLLR